MAAFILIGLNANAQPVVRSIAETGPATNRVKIVFLAEGFTASEIDKFFTTATNLSGGFFATAPFGDYRSRFNVHAIFVPSNESGSDHPDTGIFKDTYFNSSYDTYGYFYATSIPPNDRDRTYANGQGKVDEVLALVPGCDIPIMIINDPAYGGSGGRVPMCSMAPASRDLAIHEIGHSFAGLGDEYEAPYPGFPIYEEPNTTRETDREKVKWKAWIEPDTPVPTPDTFGMEVGLFEGARYFSTGWYRPQRDCKMRTLPAPFCAVCSEALVKEIYERVRPIDAANPSTNTTQNLPANGGLNLSIATPDKLSVEWQINGIAVAGETNSTFSVTGSALTAGTNTVKAVVIDPTAYVRNDPDKLLSDSAIWTIHRTSESYPSLTVSFNGGIVLSYPASATNFILQSAATAVEPNWQKVTAPPLIFGDTITVALPFDSAQRYFRLISIGAP